MTATDRDDMHLHTDLIEAWLNHLASRRRHSPRTISTYREGAMAAHHGLPYGLPMATTAELEQWLASHHRWRPATLHLRTRTLTYFFTWAVATGRLDWDPAAALEQPRLPRRRVPPATTEQVATILAGTTGDVWLASALAAYGGLRAVEVTRLAREHVTEQAVAIHGKGDHEREVPTHDVVWSAVRDLPAGRLVRERSLSQACWRAYRRAGAETSIHKLRKWYASQLWRAGVDLETIRQLLGHQSLATTQRYLADVDAGQRAAAMSALPTLT